MRDGLPVRVARKARSAAGRSRRDAGAARHGAAHAGGDGLVFPLVEANAEDVPLPDASFDLAVSEYGASLWCDPARWIPEAARLLRPDGRLVFLTNSTLATLCLPWGPGPATESLQRPQRGIYAIAWEHEDGLEFHPGHGEWIDVLRAAGFEVERLVELYAPGRCQTIRSTTPRGRVGTQVAE